MPDTSPCAAIDVGTNSVKIIVVSRNVFPFRLLYESTANTRLGEGMNAENKELNETAMRRTLDALKEMAEAARRRGVENIAAVGTAALREADNRQELINRASSEIRLNLEPITGQEEARLSYLAVRRDLVWQNCPLLHVMDIGGGSTEIVEGAPDSEQIMRRVSLPIGAVRISERFLRADPPSQDSIEEANEFIKLSLKQAGASPIGSEEKLVGVGGTIANLAAIDNEGVRNPEILHGYRLTAKDLDDHLQKLLKMTVGERRALSGIDPRRADIIHGGALILAQALSAFKADSIEVSLRGLRWGLLYDRFFAPNS